MKKTRIMIAFNLAIAIQLVLTAAANARYDNDVWVRIDGWLAIANIVCAMSDWWRLCEMKRGGHR